MRAAHVGEQPLYVIGGERLDQGFLSTLDIPAGTRVLLYQNLEAPWNPKSLLDLNGPAAGAATLAPLVEQVRRSGQEFQGVIHWTPDSADAETFHAMPLTGPNQQLMGVLLVGLSRRPLIELQRQVVSAAMLVGGAGILVAVLASLWFAARVTRPVESLAEAARRVACGDLGAKVEVQSSDELGELAVGLQSHDRRPGAAEGTDFAGGARGRMAGTGAPSGARVEESAVPLAGHGREPDPGERESSRNV